jgi:hypothetical protein
MFGVIGLSAALAASHPLPVFSFGGITIGYVAPFGQPPLTKCAPVDYPSMCTFDERSVRMLRTRSASVHINPDGRVCSLGVRFNEATPGAVGARLRSLFGAPDFLENGEPVWSFQQGRLRLLRTEGGRTAAFKNHRACEVLPIIGWLGRLPPTMRRSKRLARS